MIFVVNDFCRNSSYYCILWHIMSNHRTSSYRRIISYFYIFHYTAMRCNINVVTYRSSMSLITTNCTKLRNSEIYASEPPPKRKPESTFK